jgi:hypothetical protein
MMNAKYTNESGLIPGLFYRQPKQADGDAQNRYPALLYQAPKNHFSGSGGSFTFSLRDREFEAVYAKIVQSIAAYLSIPLHSEDHHKLYETMPAFIQKHGIICEPTEVVLEERVFRLNPEARHNAVLTSIKFDDLIERFPSCRQLLNDEWTLLKNVTLSDASGSRSMAIQINHRGGDGFKLTTSYGISKQMEHAYLKTCKKLAEQVGCEKHNEVIHGLYSTFKNFKKFYGITEELQVSKTMEYVTSSASERARVLGFNNSLSKI